VMGTIHAKIILAFSVAFDAINYMSTIIRNKANCLRFVLSARVQK
jgi:hypothetical protein